MKPSLPEGVAAALAAIVLVVAIVAVATRDTTPVTSSNGVAAPGTSAAPSEAPEETAQATRAAPGAARLPAGAPAASATGHPAATATAAQPGRYDYAETNSNGTRQSRYVVASQGGGKQTENTDDASTIDEVVWRPGGKFETATTFSFPSGSFRCVWSPSFVEYKFPLRIGSTWTVHTTCHPNAQSSLTLEGASRVVASERRDVGGTTVDDWIIATDATIRISSNGSTSTESTRDEDHFAPSYGITVYEVTATTDTDLSGLQTRDRTVRALQNLKPA
jgi:hypothetical protein